MTQQLFRRRLGEMLLEDQLIDGNDLLQALDYAEQNRIPLGRSLLALGSIDKETLALYLEKQLGESLVERSMMNHAQLEDAFSRALSSGTTFGRIIVRLGYVQDEDLAEIIAEDYDLPCMHFHHLNVDPDVAAMISREQALNTLFLPVERDGDILTVATARPFDELTVSELEAVSGLKVGLLVVPERELTLGIRQYLPD